MRKVIFLLIYQASNIDFALAQKTTISKSTNKLFVFLLLIHIFITV